VLLMRTRLGEQVERGLRFPDPLDANSASNL
jgi:hypothetical protein